MILWKSIVLCTVCTMLCSVLNSVAQPVKTILMRWSKAYPSWTPHYCMHSFLLSFSLSCLYLFLYSLWVITCSDHSVDAQHSLWHPLLLLVVGNGDWRTRICVTDTGGEPITSSWRRWNAVLLLLQIFIEWTLVNGITCLLTFIISPCRNNNL